MTTTENPAIDQLAYTLSSKKSFTAVCDEIERLSSEHQFRVMATHDVQASLRDKGFEREPIKIIEVCNAGFANQALQKDIHVALFMPCKFVVAEIDGATTVTLARPSMISQMLPDAGLDDLANEVEERLKKIMHQAA